MWTFAACVAIFGGLSVAGALTVSSSMMTVSNLNIQGGQYKIAAFTIDFSGDLYLKNSTSGSSVIYESLLGFQSLSGQGNRMPLTTIQGSGSTQLTWQSTSGICAGLPDISSQVVSVNGPPLFLMNAAPNDEPTTVFLASIGGYALNFTLHSNRWTGLVILDGSQPGQGPFPRHINDSQMFACGPTIQFLSPAGSPTGVFFADSTGNALSPNGGSVLSQQFNSISNRTCDEADVANMRKLMLDFFASAGNINDAQAANSVSFMAGAFETLGIFQACKSLVESMVVFGTETVTVQDSRDCEVPYSDSKWATDPCCNPALQYQQCCAPRTTSAIVGTVTNINTNVINAQCKQPSIVQSVLLDFIAAESNSQQQSSQQLDGSSFFNKYTSFMQTCNNLLFNSKCQSNQQCKYSGLCDSNSGRCMADFNHLTPLYVACFLDQMLPDLRLELANIWGLPSIFGSTADAQAAFANQFSQRMESLDCVGPQASGCQSSYTSQMDSQGNWQQVQIPGNKTCCMAQMGCQYDTWDRQTQAACTTGTPSQFCAYCQGGNCQEVSVMPQCSMSVWDSTTCSNLGGTWSITKWGQGSCTTTDQTATACLSSPMCNTTWPGADASNYWRCSFPSCYGNASISQATCNNLQQTLGGGFFFDNVRNMCFFYGNSGGMSACEANPGFTFWPGRTFQDGRYFTQGLCQNGMCSIQELAMQNASQSTCLATGHCTQNCRKCVSNAQLQQFCILPSVNQSTCTSMSATSWNTNIGQCINQQLNQSACAASNYIWASCGQYNNNQSGCAAGPYQSALQCQWQDYSSCDNAQQCQAAGSCDDWEYNSCSFNTGAGQFQCTTTGCVYPYNISTGGWPQPCPSNMNNGKLGCVDTTVANSATCTANGGTWHVKAFTQAQCQAHGMACLDNFGNINGYSQSDCSACGLTWGYAYNWAGGQWQSGQWLPGTWMTRSNAWVNINNWTLALDWGKVNDQVGTAVGTIMARQMINSMRAQYVPMIQTFDKISCACGSGVTDTSAAACLAQHTQATIIAQCRMDPGAAASCGPLVFDKNTVTGNNSLTISAQQISATAALISGSGLVGRSLVEKVDRALSQHEVADRSTSVSVDSYRLVKNSAGTVVGQILGNAEGYTAPVGGSFSTVQLCVDINAAIPTDSVTYSVYDLANATSTGGVGLPLGQTGTKTGLKVCGTVSSTGSYYPIFRVSNWQTYSQSNNSSSGFFQVARFLLAVLVLGLLAVM